LRIVISFSTP